MKRVVLFAGWMWVLLSAKTASACPVCFSSTTDEVLHTYYLSAAFLTLLPLGLVGGFIAFVYWSVRKRKPS